MQKQLPVSFYLLTIYYFWIGVGGLLTGLFASFEMILAGMFHFLIFLLFVISALLKDKTSRILMFITAAVSLLLQLLIGSYCLVNQEFIILTAPLGVAILSGIVMGRSEIPVAGNEWSAEINPAAQVTDDLSERQGLTLPDLGTVISFPVVDLKLVAEIPWSCILSRGEVVKLQGLGNFREVLQSVRSGVVTG